MVPNARNAIISIKSNIIRIWHDVIRPTSKQILLDSKLRKENSVLICSSILTIVNIKQIVIVVYSGKHRFNQE